MAAPSALAGLAPVAPATGQPGYYREGWVDPYEHIGGPEDHSHYTWEDPPAFPWLMIQEQGFEAPPDPVLGVGYVPGQLPPGTDPSLYASPTETGSHTAPWPSFSIDDFSPRDTDQAAIRAQLNQDLRAADAGQADAFTHRGDLARPWDRHDAEYVSAGQTDLQGVPNQLRGNLGRDRVQGYAPVNQDGFDSAHVLMPEASTELAGAYLWLTPNKRPVVVRQAGVRYWPTGSDSPFEGQQLGGGLGDTTGAVILDAPPAYAPPPEPELAPALTGGDTVWSSW